MFKARPFPSPFLEGKAVTASAVLPDLSADCPGERVSLLLSPYFCSRRHLSLSVAHSFEIYLFSGFERFPKRCSGSPSWWFSANWVGDSLQGPKVAMLRGAHGLEFSLASSGVPGVQAVLHRALGGHCPQ